MPAARTPDDFPIPTNLRDAAVLVPIFRDDAGELHVVLVRRSGFGIHGGQLAFPGGKPEPFARLSLAGGSGARLTSSAKRATLQPQWDKRVLPACSTVT